MCWDLRIVPWQGKHLRYPLRVITMSGAEGVHEQPTLPYAITTGTSHRADPQKYEGHRQFRRRHASLRPAVASDTRRTRIKNVPCPRHIDERSCRCRPCYAQQRQIIVAMNLWLSREGCGAVGLHAIEPARAAAVPRAAASLT